MRISLGLFPSCALAIIIGLPTVLSAQEAKCKPFLFEDAGLLTYPPIARAAHMEATMHYRVVVPVTGESQVSFVDGPNRGVWKVLADNAREYLAARKYKWFEGQREPCSYIASVEYRFMKTKPVDPPNNFLRITVIDATHTLVEAKLTVNSVQY